MINLCPACGGTGDRYDEQTDSWADPRANCPDCGGTGETRSRAGPGRKRRPRVEASAITRPDVPSGLYDMGLRITNLILAREQALALLARASGDVYVRAAIYALENEPMPGEPGGPAREASERFNRMPERMERAMRKGLEGVEPADRQAVASETRATQLIGLVANGLTNKEIGSALGLSENTVKSHLKRLFLVTGASNRTHLAHLLRERTNAA
jgi:DNA-binding CsgD family transcriptional regulator